MPGPMSRTPACSAMSVKVPPAVAIVVAPMAVESEAVIAPVHSRSGRYIAKRAIAGVVKQKVRRAVLGIVIRRGVAVFSYALVVAVEAQIKVKLSVPVIVAKGGPGECALGWSGKFEGVSL